MIIITYLDGILDDGLYAFPFTFDQSRYTITPGSSCMKKKCQSSINCQTTYPQAIPFTQCLLCTLHGETIDQCNKSVIAVKFGDAKQSSSLVYNSQDANIGWLWHFMIDIQSCTANMVSICTMFVPSMLHHLLVGRYFSKSRQVS